jgi:hypothetical protein
MAAEVSEPVTLTAAAALGEHGWTVQLSGPEEVMSDLLRETHSGFGVFRINGWGRLLSGLLFLEMAPAPPTGEQSLMMDLYWARKKIEKLESELKRHQHSAASHSARELVPNGPKWMVKR